MKKVEFNRERPFDSVYELFCYLRSPDGCPWDREQKFDNYVGFLKEELKELDDAGMGEERIEETLDVFFNSLMLLICLEEEGVAIKSQLSKLYKKYFDRHPHVFGNENAKNAEDVLEIWERVKKEEAKKKK